MSLSLYRIQRGAFERCLNALLAILDKAEAHAKARKFDPTNYLGMRLAPDMFPLAGRSRPSATTPRTRRLVSQALAAPVVRGQGGDLCGAARTRRPDARLSQDARRESDRRRRRPRDRVPGRPIKFRMRGGNYLVHYVLPNFYFHLTTAYDILRAPGSRSANATSSARSGHRARLTPPSKDRIR